MPTNIANSSPSAQGNLAASQESLGQSMIRCISCGAESSANGRFCGKCGEQLWDPCLSCEEKNPVDVKFCGSCGKQCEELVKTLLSELAEGVTEADKLAKTGRYLDAGAKLQSLKKVEHSQLRELIAQIQERIERFTLERDQAVDRLKQVLEEVRPLIQECKYEAAHKELISVPSAFRNQEHGEILAGVESKLSESKRLREVVKQALASRNFDELYNAVPRLVELNPDDEQLQKLQSQIEQRQAQQQRQDSTQLLKIAKAALAKCDYAQAQAAIGKLPAASHDDAELSKVTSAIKERIWLAEQMRKSPFVTPALQVVSERLSKLQPHDKLHAKLDQELKVRLQKAANESNNKAIAWSKRLANNSLGLPISLLEPPSTITAVKHGKVAAGQSMLIAYGLALQGIGQAKIRLDLAPKERKTSWLKKLSRKGAKKGVTSAWGIDIGSKYLKAVQLNRSEDGQQIDVARSIIMRYKENDCEGAESAAARSETIKTFLKENSVEGQVVVLNIDGTQTLGRFFDIPAPKPEKFFEAVTYEVKARIPLEEERLCFEYHWSALPSDEDSTTERRRVVLVAAERQIVQQRLSSFTEAEVAQLLVQSDCVALCNLFHHIQPQISGEPVAVVEIGAKTSNFVVLSDSTFWFRGLYLGSDAFDKAISAGLKTTMRDAQQLRLQPEKVRALHEMDELLQPEFANFTKELQRTLRRYQEDTGNAVSKLFFCGAGSQQLGLLSHFYSA